MPSKIIEMEHPCLVKDLLMRLARELGEPFQNFILDPAGRPNDSILIFINDTHVGWNEPEALKDGNIISLMSPVSGG